MRLTLRGLLAYLDDRLTPELTAQVNEYLGEHDKVRQLSERINRVIRRRRLSTPDMAERQDMPVHHQDDPNEVAAFLDGTMNHDQEVAFEQICIDTDVYLAEVAACHQLMTFGNDTLKVPPLAKQRMVGLVTGPEAQPLRVVPKVARPSKPPLWEVADSAPANDDEENQALLEPFYHTLLETRWRNSLFIIGAVLMTAVVGFVLLSIPWGRLPVTSEAAETVPTVPAEVEKTPPAPVNKVPEKAAPVVAKPVLRNEGVWPVPVIAIEGQPNWLAAGQTLAGITGMVAARPTLPFNVLLGLGEEPSINNDTITPLPPVAAVKTRIAAPERITHAPVAINGSDTLGMFLQLNTNDEWRITKPQASLISNELLMALPGYTGNITVPNGIRVILLGQFSPNLSANPYGEAIVELHPTQDADADLTLHRGRLVIQGRAARQVPAVVRIRYLGETWELTLPSGSEVGIQARGQVVPGDGPWIVEQSIEVIASKAIVTVKHEDQSAQLTPKQRLLWNNRLPENKPAEQSELGELPIWLAKYQTAPKEAVDSLIALRARTHAKLQKSGKDLTWFSLACDETLEEGKLIDRQAAMLGLATIGRLQPLVALQNDIAANGRRKFSHEAIRLWLNQDPGRAQSLIDLLKETGYTEDDAKLLLALYRGATKSTPATLQALLQDMAHGRVAIREQAWQVLTTLEPDRPNIYDPAGPEDQRAKAISIIGTRLSQKRNADIPPPP